jgi:hypothetical protein
MNVQEVEDAFQEKAEKRFSIGGFPQWLRSAGKNLDDRWADSSSTSRLESS